MNFSQEIRSNSTKVFDRENRNVSAVNFNQNSIIALLKGPDRQYKDILSKDNEKLTTGISNDQCRDKNSFLQVYVRPLNAKEQKRLLKKQHRQLLKQHRQSIKNKDKCLHFTFPINYPCQIKCKRNRASTPSNASISSRLSSLSSSSSKQAFLSPTTSRFSNQTNRLKSPVSISFINDQSDDISTYKNSPLEYSSSLHDVPSKKTSKHQVRSSNACLPKRFCQRCNSMLSNGICSCIVPYLLQVNDRKENDFRVQLNDLFENLTSNNIIT